MTIIIGVLLLLSVILNLGLYCEMQYRDEVCHRMIFRLIREKNNQEYENNRLRKSLQFAQYSNMTIKPVVPEGTLDAVKLAMKVSHPDNNGNVEDFIKYRKIYNILIGK